MTTLYATPQIVREDRPDGGILLRSAEPLADHSATILHSLREWAAVDPEHALVAERAGDEWRTVSYGEAVAAAESIGQGLIDLGLGASRPLLVLSGNSVDHLLVTLGAMTAGVPVAPTSTAYSLQSQDHHRIREIVELVTPGAVFAADADRFGAALDAVAGVPRIASVRAPGVDRTVHELRDTEPGDGVRSAAATLGPDSLAKILFTSGSTGSPKGVLTTHGMLASNQQMMRQVWPFLEQERPIIVDWLPWSHTFGGSHNLDMMVVNGGTIYVDDGGPAPAVMPRTLANLADVPPTIFFNVPAGYAQLVPVLESDAAFAARFFSRMRLLFNAAAALPSALRERLCAVAERTAGRHIPVTGSWGLTETAPAVTNAHFEFDDARQIGVPLPGAEVLLAPVEEGYEIRTRGPMVTPGYFRRPDLTQAAFDDEGFYRTGDGVQLADESDPNAGLLFGGRVAEDFKLSSGTFVRVGAVRTALLSALPVLTDAVIVGQDRDEPCALAWLNVGEAQKLLGREPTADGAVFVDEELSRYLARALGHHGRQAGRAGRIERMLLMTAPADLDAGEITDKGYVNQRRVIALRAELVRRLYDEPSHPSVITAVVADTQGTDASADQATAPTRPAAG